MCMYMDFQVVMYANATMTPNTDTGTAMPLGVWNASVGGTYQTANNVPQVSGKTLMDKLCQRNKCFQLR